MLYQQISCPKCSHRFTEEVRLGEHERCLVVMLSGVCSHPDNSEHKMHACARPVGHSISGGPNNGGAPSGWHKCTCGKEWTENKCSS